MKEPDLLLLRGTVQSFIQLNVCHDGLHLQLPLRQASATSLFFLCEKKKQWAFLNEAVHRFKYEQYSL